MKVAATMMKKTGSKGGNSSIPLVVSVVKGNGQFLEFGVTAYANEIAIESLSVKDSNASQDDIPYEGPDFGLWMRTYRGHSTST
ncbi:hypothetical protein Syun_029558 [Stephania yunnanensis]|uniref:Uncharacterized protein n=1 Tax=Stephania yunnanensis TaxID=152371 RepID=A0AAP0HHE4_9MAGN